MTIAGLILSAAAGAAAAASAPAQDAPASPPPSEAREVVEAQLRTPPRQDPRPLTRQEKQVLLERYLETMGRPIEQPRRDRAGN
jgi:hypothetical protein